MDWKHEKHLFFNAVMFYSRIPVPSDTPYSPDLLSQSRKYFTCIGVIIGLIGVAVYLLAITVLPINISVLLSMIACVLATGAFHEDGFADSCDALGGGWEAKQILTIMKDSRIGTYGTLGLFAMIGLKFAILLELASISGTLFCMSTIAAHAFSRWHSSRQVKLFGYVQDIDKSKIKPIATSPLSESAERISSLFGIAPVLLLALTAFFTTFFAAIASFYAADKFMWYCNKRLGGYTGDILGAIQQVSELTFLLLILALTMP